ncbi:hypothetical protein [Hymenobacter psychrotolerans]|uniref:Outer membrane protein beta-barrel domain-containing protein n=1 Tax=Hymenobacter psychrotolerans DSM 18569 TaxID=1121959 RepID=A0A1M6QEI9_9BACT|nr:hypothetical protein [Hymenobacter psychrotolerans]SHK18530.1 hypothetical protein SAMN02746009_00534 [Hymenobacter psychrotolerans DSM 18569]
MRQLSVRTSILLGLLLLRAGGAAAQDATPVQEPHRRTVPFFLTLQIGGGAGMVALGGGVRLAGQHMEPEVLLGYVPRRFSSQPLAVFTFKTTYLPINAGLGRHWNVSPAVGGYISYTHGNTMLDSKEPGKYPGDYYWFSSKVRTGAYFAPRVSYSGVRAGAPRVAAYAELGTNDLYFWSRATNKKALSWSEILTLGFGSKVAW